MTPTRLVTLCVALACSAGCTEDSVGSETIDYGEPATTADGRPPTGANPGGSQSASSDAGQSAGPGGNQGGSTTPTTQVDAGAIQREAGAVQMAQVDAGGMASGSACDLSGRWLYTAHLVTDAIGALQTTHTWIYYEIERQGDGYAIKKGLHCGDEGVADGLFPVEANFKPTFAAVMSKIGYVGRSVSSTKVSSGCDVRFAKWYTIRGATTPYYNDPATTLPTAQQPASGSTPGWEDWDKDGNPGITGTISGTATGKIFVAPRQWTEFAGTVPDLTSKFRLPLNWNQEQNVMAYDGSIILGSSSAKAGDPKLHFVQLSRLATNQATGDDAAICKAVLELSATLNPEASKI